MELYRKLDWELAPLIHIFSDLRLLGLHKGRDQADDQEEADPQDREGGGRDLIGTSPEEGAELEEQDWGAPSHAPAPLRPPRE